MSEDYKQIVEIMNFRMSLCHKVIAAGLGKLLPKEYFTMNPDLKFHDDIQISMLKGLLEQHKND